MRLHTGGRQLLQAAPALAPSNQQAASGSQGAAPGPGPAEPTADILFTLTAAGARLSADKLELLQVAPVTTFFTTQSKAGAYMTSAPGSPLPSFRPETVCQLICCASYWDKKWGTSLV